MSKHLSPAAQLLRSSRVFSVPPPLPRPNLEFSGGNGFRRSDTATLPYPIRQAIDASASSRFHGDWGLKRALPRRSTTKSTGTALRLTAIDTSERITDYESSSDFTKTLEKFQELGLAMETAKQQDSIDVYSGRVRSAFDADYDYTDKKTAPPSTPTLPPRRWKYSGPNVGTMTDGEFEAYIMKQVKDRKDGFNQYLEQRLYEQFIDKQRKEARANMTEAPTKETVDAGRTDVESQTGLLFGWLADMPLSKFRSYIVSYQERTGMGVGKDGELVLAPEETWNSFKEWLNELTLEDIHARQHVYNLMLKDIIESPQTSASSLRQASSYLSLLPKGEFLSRWGLAHKGMPTLQPPPSFSRFTLFRESQLENHYSLDQYREILFHAHETEKEYVQSSPPRDLESYMHDCILDLRADTKSDSKLNTMICEYLDMRPVTDPLKSQDSSKLGGASHNNGMSTHPSGGLSYLRTNAILENHPILGPQAERKPIEARVLVPKLMDTNRVQQKAVLGVAGIAVQEPPESGDLRIGELDLNARGGGKVWVEATRAHVDWQGRIQLDIKKPQNRDAIELAQGKLSRSQPLSRGNSGHRPPLSNSRGRFDRQLDSGTGSYGELAGKLGSKSRESHETNKKLQGLLSQLGNSTTRRRPGMYPTS